jgi:predicted GNAT family acetyltransferase
MTTDVHDEPDAHRFEIHVDGELAGFARYVRKGGRIYFVHTEIDPAFEGKGLGSVLASRSLDAVRSTGEPVVPLCPFIASFIERHPAYDDLVDKELLTTIEG